MSGTGYLQIYNGTPFKSIVWRLLGVRVGKKLFDDGAAMPEKTMVTIGDYCTLGAQSTIQCHSLEDGGFKSDYVVIGSGSTIGANSYVHYGVVMGERVVIEADAFLMKGEQPGADTRWQGNPAREIPDASAPAVPPTRRQVRKLARRNAREARQAARQDAWQSRHGRHARRPSTHPANTCPTSPSRSGSGGRHLENAGDGRRRRAQPEGTARGTETEDSARGRWWRRRSS